MDIYKAEKYKDGYQEPVLLENLNSDDVENDLVVDPQERFIIFNRYISSTNDIDLYMSFKDNGRWESPFLLTRVNKPEQWELTPTLSPNGKYLFYEVNNQIWQIRLSALLENKGDMN